MAKNKSQKSFGVRMRLTLHVQMPHMQSDVQTQMHSKVAHGMQTQDCHRERLYTVTANKNKDKSIISISLNEPTRFVVHGYDNLTVLTLPIIMILVCESNNFIKSIYIIFIVCCTCNIIIKLCICKCKFVYTLLICISVIY